MKSENRITPDLIKRTAGEYDLELVRWLDLSNCKIRVIEGLDLCGNLLNLTLSRNYIQTLYGLDALQQLQRLDLSFNCIKKIENLENLKSLEFLDLRGNSITNIDDFGAISNLKNLHHLFIKDYTGRDSNPVCKEPNYFFDVTRFLPYLHILDGESIILRKYVEEAAVRYSEAEDNAYKSFTADPWFNLEKYSMVSNDAEIDDMLKDCEQPFYEVLNAYALERKKLEKSLAQLM